MTTYSDFGRVAVGRALAGNDEKVDESFLVFAETHFSGKFIQERRSCHSTKPLRALNSLL